jgi:hypothetical protein
VAGIKAPFRVRRMAGSKASETWEVKEFQIDAPIAPSVFKGP